MSWYSDAQIQSSDLSRYPTLPPLVAVHTRHKRRYEPSAAELAAAGKAPTTADAEGDRETGQASRENGQVGTEAPGATDNPATEDAGAASSAKGQSSRKKSRGNADTGLATELRGKHEEEGEEEDDEHKFSEWKVHPRWTPRKDIALQVTQCNLPTA